MPQRMRKAPGDALQVGKHPVAAFVMQPVQGGCEKSVVIHTIFYFPRTRASPFLEGFQGVCRGKICHIPKWRIEPNQTLLGAANAARSRYPRIPASSMNVPPLSGSV